MTPSKLFEACSNYIDNCQYEGFKPKNEKVYDLCCKYFFSEITSNERDFLIDFFNNTDTSY